jgi:flavin reductase (DIM6/NTAB) family NADH-FMN oxidoreductase RutF
MAKTVIETSALLYPVMTALVTCQGIEGKPNILTVSWGGILRTYPPLVGIGIQKIRFSHKLIKMTKEFVINMPSEELLWAVDICGWVSGEEEDKFKKTGLTPIPSRIVKVPSIKECPVNLECKVKDVIDMDPYDFFIGEVVSTIADEEVLLPGADKAEMIAFKEVLNVVKCKPLSYVAGGGRYWTLREGVKPIFFTKEQPSPEQGGEKK